MKAIYFQKLLPICNLKAGLFSIVLTINLLYSCNSLNLKKTTQECPCQFYQMRYNAFENKVIELLNKRNKQQLDTLANFLKYFHISYQLYGTDSITIIRDSSFQYLYSSTVYKFGPVKNNQRDGSWYSFGLDGQLKKKYLYGDGMVYAIWGCKNCKMVEQYLMVPDNFGNDIKNGK